MFRKLLVLGAAVAALSMPAMAADTDYSGVLSKIKLPPGFKIEVFAEMPKARSIEVGKPNGVIYVGSRHGYIYSMVDNNRDGKADEVRERVTGLNVPNGLAMQDSILYVGMQDRIANWPVPAEFDTALPLDPLLTINDNMTNDFLHGWRYIGFGPDRKLYVSLGAPCNICDLTENTGKIVRMNPDGSEWEVVADGVRNSVGFDWNPVTGDLWFTDNGADGMGDNIPPDELNHVTRVGQNFGFPYLGGKDVKLTGMEDKEPPVELTPPVIEFGAHTANLGLEFYNGDMFPAEYKNDAFVAQHGSWNRTVPDGYRIMRVTFDDKGNATGTEVFADGWLSDDGAAVGRPVDIEELPDGSLLVSDDFANVIYRISYGGQAARTRGRHRRTTLSPARHFFRTGLSSMTDRTRILLRLCAGAAMMLAALPQAVHAQDARAGKAKARMCTPCHGADGIAVAPNAPHIAGENARYLSAQLEAFRDGERQNHQMSIIAKGLSDEDIANLALWFSMFEIEATPPKLD